MGNTSELIGQILNEVEAVDYAKVLVPAQIGEGEWRNELLLFVKPEIFLVEETAQKARSLQLIFDKLNAFEAEVAGVSIVAGRALEELEIMNQHYGFINKMSRMASEIIDAEGRAKVAELLEINLDEYDILGGHEYLAEYPNETSKELDELWFEEASTKIRSGFYVRKCTKDGRNIVLVNAFHPEQLAHFTQPERRIVLMLIHSNNDWSTLKNQMVGATFPEDAASESIRGTLHADPQQYGFEEVTIANNSVHLSAGPYEAMFEIINFFGKILDLDLNQQPTMVLRRLMDADLSSDQAMSSMDNPDVSVDGEMDDLFTATEDMDTDEAVVLFRANV